MLKKDNISYHPMTQNHFDAIIALGNQVHGDGYLNHTNIKDWYQKGIKNQINANYVALDGDQLIAFRISFAPENWAVDKWYSPELWHTAIADTAYFKCNTVAANYRGLGIGSELLRLSIASLKQQGAKSGVSHLWRQSPGNSAVGYFSKCGGVLVKDHPDKWHQDSKEGYECTLCGNDCHCVAAEMIIYFEQ
ncbi:GNAT family N-acetyltransferase [Thalassotalea aquiviva]|uniref:GNAT family N-acetyltransferase n=1 Tax=Thalassotalea aquiviva TaxID=3242415 RepID=UPI00352B5F0C